MPRLTVKNISVKVTLYYDVTVGIETVETPTSYVNVDAVLLRYSIKLLFLLTIKMSGARLDTDS